MQDRNSLVAAAPARAVSPIHVLKLYLADTLQMFDSMDPAPFHERDLDPKAVTYIVDWAREAPSGVALGLEVHLGRQSNSVGDTEMLRVAVDEHFRRCALATRRQLRELFRVGRISLVIGLGFVALVVAIGESISQLDAHALVGRGLAMVPEGRGVFARMTITENLQMGAYSRKDRAGIAADIERMFETFPRLKERARQYAGTMSGGEQQMLAMARALMSRPALLLLDEPSMGLSPIMVEKIFEVVRDVSSQGMTILLVEQNARLALQSAHRAYVMDSGLITLQGEAKQMLEDPKVRAAYLGEEAEG